MPEMQKQSEVMQSNTGVVSMALTDLDQTKERLRPGLPSKMLRTMCVNSGSAG